MSQWTQSQVGTVAAQLAGNAGGFVQAFGAAMPPVADRSNLTPAEQRVLVGSLLGDPTFAQTVAGNAPAGAPAPDMDDLRDVAEGLIADQRFMAQVPETAPPAPRLQPVQQLAPPVARPAVQQPGTGIMPVTFGGITIPPINLVPAGTQPAGQPPAPPPVPVVVQTPPVQQARSELSTAMVAMVAVVASLLALGGSGLIMWGVRRADGEDKHVTDSAASFGRLEKGVNDVLKGQGAAAAELTNARKAAEEARDNARDGALVLIQATGATKDPLTGNVSVDRIATRGDVDRARRAVWAAAAKAAKDAQERNGTRPTALTAEEARRLLAPLAADAAAARTAATAARQSVWQGREEARSAFDRLGRRKVAVRITAAE